MRLANINGRLALRAGDGFVDVASTSGERFGPDPQSVYTSWPEFTAWAREATLDGDTPEITEVGADVVWGPAVPAPRQIFAIGLNYRDHARESGIAVPEEPPVFTKFPTSLTGHGQDVVLPEGSVDWEAELVVVMGRACRHATRETAWQHVAGLTVGQDLSERRLQLTGPVPQFSLGKSYPGFAPVGPEVVTLDEFDDPDDLELGCRLEDGEILQKGRTSNMVFDVPELIVRLSAVCPLLPGDLIFTGTPAGVGAGRTPQRFLAPGDVLVTWVEGIGTLTNRMVSA
ncbi:fumarylacetoacetate hydrolase family protein [Streptomyces sp. NBC_00687]|uniref:fumarylacetoacetate hydrolase family protein n=1 Tax=Streptomyces sp. NBC_00687 TaxID=2975807 RepID=UPI00225BAD07|nr:fumarylacetoacetate hydrolase family protein [Streptomyces sp. NBC_00687]MCX4919039.1 fumarylacetoacetate hydrolase family protein [Streptomyces sp. NBC_00687]